MIVTKGILSGKAGKGIVATLCAIRFFTCVVFAALPGDEFATPDASASMDEGTPAAGTSKPTEDSTGADDANPAGRKSARNANLDDEEPPQKPVGRERELMESGTSAAGEATHLADDVPVPTSPQLQKPFSQWDLSGIESPLFATEQINEFSERSILLTGRWSVKPHLTATTIYDGNIFVRSTDTTSDFITRVAPGLSVRLGDAESQFYLVGDYTAGLNWYMQHPSESNVDQNAKLDFQWSLPKTTLGVHLGVLADSGADIDATDRVKRRLYYAGITTHYTFGEKTSWDVNADYSRSDYDGLISSSQVEGQVYFNYEYSPKFMIGVGGTLGYVMVAGGADQVFEQGSVRATYRVTGKLTLISELGVEFREYGGGGGQSITPVFNIQAAWMLREGTELDVSARRQIYSSAVLQSQNYAATSLNVTVRQRFTDRVELLLSGGFVNASYTATAGNVAANREDNYFYIRPAIQWRALSWLSIGVFYEYSQDVSSGGGDHGFTRDRGGIQLAILF